MPLNDTHTAAKTWIARVTWSLVWPIALTKYEIRISIFAHGYGQYLGIGGPLELHQKNGTEC